MIARTRKLYADLHVFIGIVGVLIIIGGLFIYSASSVYALEAFGNAHYFVKKQLIGLCIGLIVLIAIQAIPLHSIKKWSPHFFIGSILLTAGTLVPFISHRIHGSSRWIKVFPGFTFQPSELLKIGLVLYLAHFITKRMHRHTTIARDFIPLMCSIALPSLILLKQPDFGLTVTLFATTFTLLFIAQFHLKHLIACLAACMPIGIALIVMKPYRLQRILTFLNPWQDPQGSGFQIIQSLIAVGSGNTWGTGIAHSKQKFFYLPMQHTDFIFSIIAEETGFIGCAFLLSLLMLLLYSGIRLATSLRDTFCTLAILGFIILINLQSVINIAVATGLLPTKGIGLPFVSYGNSALVCNLAMIGVIINMVRNAEKQ